MTRLPTYTSVFRLRRRLYAVYDWELPVPVGLLEIAVFSGGLGFFTLLARVLGIPLTAGTAWFFVVPPGFLAYLARQPVADHKPPHKWAVAQLRFVLEPRQLAGLEAAPHGRDEAPEPSDGQGSAPGGEPVDEHAPPPRLPPPPPHRTPYAETRDEAV